MCGKGQSYQESHILFKIDENYVNSGVDSTSCPNYVSETKI